MRSRRHLALAALLGAALLAVAAFPFRATWWGGLLLAVAEAGVVGGLADWFAVTALFRRPLGLPIPHTALIPANWELLASRVGTMVGDRVLTRQYLADELARLDLADLLARAAARLGRADLERAARVVLGWVARELPPEAAGEAAGRLGRLLAQQPAAPLLARALDLAREHGWDERAAGALAAALAEGLERPGLRQAVGELVDELLARYRERSALYPRMMLGLAELLGLVDRERIVRALAAGLGEVARQPDHPVRRRVGEAVGELARRLREDRPLAARVEAVKRQVLQSPVVARLAADLTAALRRAVLEDLGRAESDLAAWVAGRLEDLRQAVLTDAPLRAEVDGWVRRRAGELVDRHHGRIAGFIEKGVHALGPEGAVRLIEEHAGDDLQFIRINGTVVGGLAGGAIYAVHLLARAL